MKTNPELFNKHFEEYKEWVISHKKLPTLSDDAKFSDGTKMQTWRANYKEKIIGFENSMKEIVSQENITNKKLKRGTKIFAKYVDIEKCYPWEPKTLDEYLDGDNRYHFYTIDTYISLMKYMNESLNDIGWLLFYKSLFGDNPKINNTFIGNKDKFEMFKKISMDAFNTLTNQEHQAICIRFGLNDGCQKSLDETGKELNVTPERVRQVIAKAIRKLRHPSRFKEFWLLDQVYDNDLDINHGIGHWFIISYDGKKIIVKRNMAELEEVLEHEGFDYSLPFGSYEITSVQSYTHYGYQIDPEIRLLINELLPASSNYKIFNYTEVSLIKQKPIKSVKEYVEEYHQDMINEQKRQEMISESHRRTKENSSRGIFSNRRSVIPGIPWGLNSIQSFEDRAVDLFKNEFPVNLNKIINSLVIDKDHTWVDEFNKLIRKYFIPVGCGTFATIELKKCLDTKLDDYTIEVIFSAPSDTYHYLYIKFISDSSERGNG